MCQLMASRYDDHNNRPSHSKQNWNRGNPSSYDKHNRHDQSHDKLTSGDSRSSGSRKDRNEENKEKSKPRQIGDWSEHTSSSGKRYYYNVVTEQSQWEKPLEWIEFEKLNGLSKQKRSANHAEPTTNGQDRSRSSVVDERSRSSSSRHQHDIANGGDVANNWPNCRDEATSSSKRQRDNSTAESSGSQHYRNDNGYTADRDRPNHSRKRREQADVSPKHLSSSPKRRKGERDNDLNTILVEDTNASASCSNDMDSSNADGLGDVDLEKLPELLVEIAEKYSIDLRQPDALEKLKHYLKSTLQIDHQIIEAKAEESALSTVIQPSPSSSAKSNCIDSATDPEEAAVDSLPEARVPRIPTPLPEIPILSQNHLIYFREPLAAHVAGWSAEVFERQARFVNDEAFRTGCLQVAQVSADLKCARSLVRTAEIRATLLEQRISFLRQQQEKLDVKRQSASSATTN